MQKDNASVIAKEFIKSMKTSFADAVSGIILQDVSDNPIKKFSIKFNLYDYFVMRLNYEKGHFGCCICYGEYAIALKTTIEWDDNCSYEEYWREVEELVKIRIPDKYLEKYGWI